MSDRIRPGASPTQLVVDPETRLESGLTLFTCLTSVLFVMLAMGLASTGVRSFQGLLVLGLACLAGLGGWARYQLDDHFVFDFETKELAFVRKFFGRSRSTRVSGFDQLFRLAILPEKNANKQGVWWEYGLALVLRDGRQFTLITPTDKDRDKVVVEAKSLAQVLNLELAEGEPEKMLEVTAEPLSVDYVEYRDDSLKWIFAVIGICLALPLLVALAAAMAG